VVGTVGTGGNAYGDVMLASVGAAGDASAIVGATAGQFRVNSSSGSFDITYNPGASAADIATTINNTPSGVKASAVTQVVLGDGAISAGGFAQNASYTFYISSDFSPSVGGTAPDQFTTISFKTGGSDGTLLADAPDQLNAAVQAFNDASGKTGFTAQMVKTDSGRFGIKLTNEAGRDLRIMNDSATANSAGSTLDVAVADIAVLDGNTATTSGLVSTLTARNSTNAWTAGNGTWYTGRVVFDSDKSFSVTTTVADLFQNAATPGTAAVGTYGAQLQATEKVDVSTFDAALRTLNIVDSALASLSSQRSRFGALQSRFDNTIINLQTTSENLSASRSRIRDADFAEETAKLARNQVLQQAGLAMLSQANQLPQQVLSLLQR
jgi:flagellin